MLASPVGWSAYDHQLSSKLAAFQDQLLQSVRMAGDLGTRRLLPQHAPMPIYSFVPPNAGAQGTQKSTSYERGVRSLIYQTIRIQD